jgi:bifunctional non-homologous end joining protein LigD
VREPFDDREWLFELKLDGFRVLAYTDPARLVSRNGNVFRRFAPLAAVMREALAGHAAILDGELVAVDRDGRPDFYGLLFGRRPPDYFAFDVLWLDGADLRARPLLERKRILRELLRRRRAGVHYLTHVRRRGADLFAAVTREDLEGIVAKPVGAPYALLGERSPWLKIKNREYSQARDRHEFFGRRSR